MIHSDQGSQFTSREWQTFLRQHNLDASMSRRGNGHDNAVAESVFHLPKQERIRRHTYHTRDAARQDGFEHIAMFYNPRCKHTNKGMLSPVDFEVRQQKLNEAGVWETRGTSGRKSIYTVWQNVELVRIERDDTGYRVVPKHKVRFQMIGPDGQSISFQFDRLEDAVIEMRRWLARP